MPAPVQVPGTPFVWTAAVGTAGTLYPGWPRPALVLGGFRVVTALPPSGIELLVDQPWTTGTDTSLACSPFDAPAGSLIILEAHLDSSAASAPATTVADSAGLTWTAIGTPQRGAAGGYSAAWWAYAATARTAVTASVNWSSSLSNKSIKPQVWTGTASSTPVISKAQGTSPTPSLTVNVTTTNHACRIGGTAVDWNAPGLPASNDDDLGYFISTRIDGISVHKAGNSSGVGSTVGLHMATAALATPDWAYKVWEIVPAPPGAGSSVNGDATLAVSTTVAAVGRLDAAAGGTLAATTTITADSVRAAASDTSLTASTTITTAGTVAAAPAVRAVTSGGTTAAGTTTNHVVSTPTCLVGDLLYASLTLNAGHGVIGAPAGWTRLHPVTITDDGFMTLLVYVRTATSLDAAGTTYTWTTSSAVKSTWGCLSAYGQDPTNPVHATRAAQALSGLTASGSIHPTEPGTLVLSTLAVDSGAGDSTPTSPLTQQWDPVGGGTSDGQINATASTVQAAPGGTTYTWTLASSLTWKLFHTSVGAVGSTPTPTASLTATTTVTTAGVRTATADTTVAASTTILAAGATGTAPVQGDTTLAVTTSLAATGRLGAVAGASLAVSTTVATAGVRGQPGSTTLAASTTVATAGVRGTVSGSTLAASTTVTTAGATVGLGSTTLPVTTTLTTVGATGSVAGLTVATTITTAATRATVGVGTLAVVTTLTAVGRLGARATTTVGVVTTVAAVAFLAARSSVSIMVVTVVGVEGTAVGPLSVLVAGSLTVIGEPDASLMTTLPSSATVIGDSLSQAVVGEARHPLEVV